MRDVQSWLDDPASNFGWLVLGDESEISTAKRFDTRESASPPVLTIIYRPAGPRRLRRRRDRVVSGARVPDTGASEVRRFFSAVTLVTVVRIAANRKTCVAAGRLEKHKGCATDQSLRP